jgi:CRISPR-associated protein Cas1
MHSLSVTEQGTQVHAEGNLLVLWRGKAALRRVKVAEIEQVLLFGRVELSSGAVALLARRGVDVVWLTLDGRFRARLATRTSRNVALRLAQYRASTDAEFCLRVARQIVLAKIRHQRAILLRAQRRLADDALAVVLGQMRLLVHQAQRETSLDSLRGFEGQAAALYFGQFGKLLRTRDFEFTHRSRRPPRDPVNACLSFGYAILGSLAESEVGRCGLDATLGFFHQPAYGRSSLTLDLIEEFRPLIDALVLRVINRRQLGPGDFERRGPETLEQILSSDVAELALGVAEFARIPDADAVDPARDQAGGAPALASDPVNDAAEFARIPAFDWSDGFDDLVAPADVREPPAAGAPATRPSLVTHQPPLASSGEVGVYLAETGRRIFLAELFRRMRERMYYAPQQAAFELREILRQQVYHLARVVEGRDAEYTPFLPE